LAELKQLDRVGSRVTKTIIGLRECS